jgi:prepilin-type N-terminal cleavage/methylation domain-containing protein
VRSSAPPVVRDERGFTLIELLTVLAMLVIVVTTLSSVLIAASKGEEDMSRRFGSQVNARIALDTLRREIHCATSVSPTGTSSSITIVLGSRCPFVGGSTVRWCTVGSGSQYALYRTTAATCDSSGKRVVDYLTTGNVFTATAQSTTSLATLSVTLPIDTNTAAGLPDYQLTDDIVLRNSTRT